jgi:hypothetical protein
MSIDRKSSFIKHQLFLVILILVLLSGCGVIKSLSALKSKKVKPQYTSYQDKSLIFVPLTHFGQKEFYAKLKDSIIHWKNNDYTIFYEQIISDPSLMGLDDSGNDTLNRKWRKIVGGEKMTREGYEELTEVFKNGMVQPEYEDLGIDSTDVNADITMFQLVQKFEYFYGEVKLDSCDFAVHLDSTYTCGKKLKGKLRPVIVDYRNKELIEKVVASDKKSIVVVYGGIHIKGMKKLLKKKEKSNH